MQQLRISTCAPKSFQKERTKALSKKIKNDICQLQKVLYAEGKRSLLIILQGVDASGKDGLIADVFSGLNPFGVNVSAFKAPSSEEKAHDFLWRIHQECPERGMIRIFNRSHYEDILVPRVNKLLDEKTLRRRMNDINMFEQILTNEGTTILKFYLHVSREEQAIRLRERKTNPEKFWKHNDEDWKNRRKWNNYMETYELIFRHCKQVPWHIVPSDQNWYKEYLVALQVRDTLRKMKLTYPTQKVVAARNGK